jgi:hypothetical protein
MIKKFKEYVNEKFIGLTTITPDEIDDQFLRLEEVLGCEVKWKYETHEWLDKEDDIKNKIVARIRSDKPEDEESILKELTSIKTRMEEMYPVTVYANRSPYYTPDNKLNKTPSFMVTIFIHPWAQQ